MRERYGIPPELVPDFIALRGDPSDGLPGAKGIGEKTAADLLRRHGSLEAAIARRDPREAGGPRARCSSRPTSCARSRTSRRCATSTVERPPDRATDRAGGAEAARALGMGRLAERLGATDAEPYAASADAGETWLRPASFAA